MAFNLNKLVQPECGAPNPLVAAAQQINAIRPHSGHQRIRSPLLTASQQQQQQQQHSSSSQLNFAKEFSQRQPPPLVRSEASNLVNSSNAGKLAALEQQAQAGSSQQQMINRGLAASLRQNEFKGTLFRAQQPLTKTNLSAGDQLEAKYREDMISQMRSPEYTASYVGQRLGASKSDSAGRLDDVEFWQSISQAYIGPNTLDTIARLRAEREPKRTEGHEAQATTTTKSDHGNEQQQQQSTDDELARQRAELWQQGELDTAQLMASIRLDEMEYTFDERNPLKDKFEDPFAEGLRRLEQGDIPSAALLFEASVQREPNNALAWRYLGTTQAQNEDDKSAIKALRNCLHLQPDDQQARLAIAVSLVNETRHREACRHLIEWLMKHERYSRIQTSLEQFDQLDQGLAEDPVIRSLLLDGKHYEYVRDRFVEAARMSPNDPDPDVQNSLGVLFNMRGEYDKAVDCFKTALSVRQEDCLLWNRLGATLANGNKSDEAVIAYRRALEISPGFLRSRYNLAISLIHLNLYDEGAKQLVQILNTQAAGQGSSVAIRTRSITSTSIWNTLRTVATLMNRPDLYPIVEGRDLAKCNQALLASSGPDGGVAPQPRRLPAQEQSS